MTIYFSCPYENFLSHPAGDVAIDRLRDRRKWGRIQSIDAACPAVTWIAGATIGHKPMFDS
jgi:hypothetical protein